MPDLNSLISRLDTQSDKAADKVIARLVQIGASTVPTLIKAAKNSKEPRIRKWSLQALGAIADKRGAPFLLDALKDGRMTVRLHALRGLGRMKFKKGAKSIAALLKDESGGIRLNALEALIKIGDRSVAPLIAKRLDDPQWYVRQSACVACGVLKIEKAKSKLKKLALGDERKAVREAAGLALTKM